MATPITPGAAAGAAAGSSSPTPSAAPSSPAPAATPTPSTPSPAAPASSGTPEVPELKPGQSARDYLREAMESGPPLVEEKKPEAATPPAGGEAAPVVAEPEKKPEPAAAAPAEPEKKPEATPTPEAVPPNPLDKIGPLPAEKLAASLEKPEVMAVLEKEGYTKDQLLQTARDAALTSQFVEAIGTPELAKVASEAAGNFYDIEDGFTSIQDLGSFDKFMSDVMLPLSVVVDDKGQPIKEADGRYKTDGTVEKFFNYAAQYDQQVISQLVDKQLAADPQNDGLLDVKAALQVLSDYRQNGFRPGKPTAAELTPEMQRREAELSTREATIRKQNETARQAEIEKYEARITEATDQEIDSLISAVVNNTGLPDKLKEKAAEEIADGLAEALESDRNFQFKAKQARAHGMSEELLKSIVAMNKGTLKAKLQTVAQKVLDGYGNLAMAQSQKDRDKTDAQLAADRMNPKGGTTAGTPGKTSKLTDDQIREQAKEDVMKASGGRVPADFQNKVLKRIMEIEMQQNPLAVA